MNNELNINYLIETAVSAGHIIMDYYRNPKEWVFKPDHSPVTEADRKANDYIVHQLTDFTPNIPVVSEENLEEENLRHITQEYFWLVDPLDGTKAFIKGLDQFTVNIALIKNKEPVIGVIYMPVKEILYYNTDANTAYKQIKIQAPVQIHTKKVPATELIITTGLSHANSLFLNFISKYNVDHITKTSSSIKFCLIAEGSADMYPHFNPTMEWDTAAGQAILTAAGGSVHLEGGAPLTYGKPKFLNPNFIAHNGNIDFAS